MKKNAKTIPAAKVLKLEMAFQDYKQCNVRKFGMIFVTQEDPEKKYELLTGLDLWYNKRRI